RGQTSRHNGELLVHGLALVSARSRRVALRMASRVLQRFLPDEAATARLGEDLAMALKAGDVLALRGDVGAGKSTLARALIRALADDGTLEVPSPTFTLVQSYAG